MRTKKDLQMGESRPKVVDSAKALCSRGRLFGQSFQHYTAPFSDKVHHARYYLSITHRTRQTVEWPQKDGPS